MQLAPHTEIRAQDIFDAGFEDLVRKTDYLFRFLFAFQWLLGIAIALFVNSPGENKVFLAFCIGGAIAAYPIFLITKNPGARFNRCVIAICQSFFSILFIHLTDGRIETHFHVFASLAFLAFYRDLRTVAVASVIAVGDQFIRGRYWPVSIYGVAQATPWRAFEHLAWIAFEDVALFYSIQFSRRELYSISKSRAELESARDTVADLNRYLEQRVSERTRQLEESQTIILNQQQALMASSKWSALGEMAGSIAHEINTPLAIIEMRASQLEECVSEGDVRGLDFGETLKTIKSTTERIAKIVSGLKNFARGNRLGPLPKVRVNTLIDDTLSLCRERFANSGVRVDVIKNGTASSVEIECKAVEISQVLLNLLNNAFDAVEHHNEKWIRIHVFDIGDYVKIAVVDSGPGIPKELTDKIMQPFFTTKEIGQGTGLGLSISKRIIEEHRGQLSLDASSKNTKFTIFLPKHQGAKRTAA